MLTKEHLYRHMHTVIPSYKENNQGAYVLCDWLHFLTDAQGVVHHPWAEDNELKPVSIVEFGCGNGILCDLLSYMNMDVTGVDIFDNEVVYDRAAYEFVQHDLTLTPYPFEDNEFDWCVCFDVLEHLPKECIDSVLKEMERISRGVIFKVACSGRPPLHITVENLSWWFEQLQISCPHTGWQLVRNYRKKRVSKSDEFVYAPMFKGVKYEG